MARTTRWLPVCCVLLVCLTACPLLADEFALDEHTLFLAHFNENVKEADYAMGWDEFAGSGASLTEGYYGKAIDLRGIQLDPKAMAKCSGRMPRLDYFGVWTRGNVSYEQGTYEFWFKIAPEDMKQGYGGRSLFFTHYFQPVAKQFINTYLTPTSLRWQWQFLKGEPFKGVVRFDPPLNPDHWHHYAMCWSPGEMVIYLDGRAIGACDMAGKDGLLLCAQTHKSVMMCAIALDELRISDVVRYKKDFEPAWRDGKRPDYAFPGVPDVRRHPAKTFDPDRPAAIPAPPKGEEVEARFGETTLRFDKATGALTGLGLGDRKAVRGTNGLLLWEGLDRERLPAPKASNWKQDGETLSFRQQFGDRLAVQHELAPRDGACSWRITFENRADKELWLEALLSLPVPFQNVKEYFDMSWAQDKLALPRRRDEHVSSLPFAAATSETEALGVGIDPHICTSALISEWVPEGTSGTIRQGTRVVLDPKAKHTLEFVIVTSEADFGVENAIATYHGLFPDLYKQKADVPIYSYMPVCRYFEYLSMPDLARLCYVGNQWGHGPGHCKGDEWGTPKYWNMPKDPKRPDHAYTLRLEKLWKSIEGLREQFLVRNKNSFDKYYTLRRSHYLPNWADRFIVEDIWPEGIVGGDRLVCGQYYPQMYYANEFNTALGKHYQQTTTKIMEHISHICPGFINDMCHTSPFRFTDSIARKTPGCAFSRDRGRYLIGAFGHVDRYKLINDFVDERGFRQSVWSDGGVVSYMLLAHSAAGAIESGVPFTQWPGPELTHVAGRYLIGEKPFVMHWSKENEWLGRCLEGVDITPAMLRDYYRYSFAQILLSSLRHGIYLPHDCIMGQQWMMEHNPILVESLVHGRKIVSAAKVKAPLFVRRSGEGMDSFLAVGNEGPKAVETDVVVTNRFFGGAPIFGAYFGGVLQHLVDEKLTTIEDITVGPRSVAAFKILGVLSGEGTYRVESSFQGDGLRMGAKLRIKGDKPSKLTLSSFAPIYEIESVKVNGETVKPISLQLPAGEAAVEVGYKNRVLDFTRQDWGAVELFKDGRTNVCLIAKTASPFNSGTANLLNEFIAQYDAEDGELGNLKKAEVLDEPPAGFDGWKVFIRPDADVSPSRVRIDRAAKEIHVEGKSSGEARRAMVVLLRLLDRKYPHIGRFYSLKYFGGDHAKMIEKRLKNKETQQFFLNLADKRFLIKPILRPEHERLYENDTIDFTGKYDLRRPPYLFEPTYGEDYVYGYAGE